ncbi:MAG: DMT family transporter [Gammaproteobacteria bacterium]
MSKNNTAPRADNIPLGVSIIIATVLAMALADAIVKNASADFPLWQIFVLRSLLALPVLFLLLRIGARASMRPLSLKWCIARSLLLVLMYVAIYAAMPLLTLSVIAASLYTGPIFVALFSALLIGEPVGARRWGAVLLGFAAVLVILRPDTGAFSFYMLVPVLAGLLYALAAIITRAKCIDEHPLTLAIILNLALVVFGLLASIAVFFAQPMLGGRYPFLLGNWTAMGAFEWGVIASLALLMVVIGTGLAKAYQSAPPSVIATFDYAYLLFAAFWGWVFFAERPDAGTVSGMLMIVIAGMLAVSKPRAPRRRAM